MTVVDLPRLRGLWHRQSVVVRDLPLALVLAVGPLVPSWRDQGTQLGDLPDRPLDALAVVAVALQCLPLAVRRRWPAVCLTLVCGGFVLDQLRGYHTAAGTALAVALVSTGVHLGRRRRVAAVVTTGAYVALAVALHRQGSTEGVSGFVTFYVLLVLAWGVGAWLRRSRAAEADHRRRAAADARATERAHIARELHDVVTHHVTAMVVQTEAARYLTTRPDRLDQSLTAVTDTGRQAISDLRRLLDVLDPNHDAVPRTPTGREIRALVEQTRRAGQPVEYVEEGTPSPTPSGAQAAAYRVVQESLTNALKHAHGSRTTVHVHHGDDTITVEVGTDGSGVRSPSPGGSERGLAGLRERVDILGGELVAQPRPGGGFVVRARIPAGSPS
ncbi:sensor histidine kinase [Cellulomonas phragmiteti]|uniref:histidine kinase n=1 Tax=Cellulomonas phragmiteti TaxID=478780 RepID=A0ABQ4DRT2_9CELL|nr:histidine kinase [Cellulomonas phragmiteti]GIG41661.1 two-component sensor histidine kinase [Cellulomonas phragmiteti]